MKPELIFAEAQMHGLPFWDSEVDDGLVCVAVRDEAPDVKTFVFEGRNPSRFFYWPGQFLTFNFMIDGMRVNRCYTIASTPTRPHLISITVKRVPGGIVSPWLHATMQPGTLVRAVGPLGRFSFLEYPAEKYLFLSGGSGVTPLMSMARTHHDLANDADIMFGHFARTPADIIFRRELEMMSFHMPRFRAVSICEEDSPAETWGGMRGRISAPLLTLMAPDFMEREIFVCGPEPFMAACRDSLAELGFDMAHHHEESFTFLSEPEPAETQPEDIPAAIADGELATFKVEFTRSKKIVVVPENGFVLDAARADGLRLPASCTKGLCGTCKSKLVSGRVDMNHQGGIRQREIDEGMILICCSTPLTDLVIDR